MNKKGNSNRDEISFEELISIIWCNKKLIIMVTFFIALCSIVISLNLKNYYKSEAVLILAGESNNTNPLSGISGIASMAGINIPQSSQNKSVIVLQTIKSREFFKHLLESKNILPALMASKNFDLNTKKIIFDNKKYDPTRGLWVRKSKQNQESKPTYLEAYGEYIEKVQVSHDKSSNLITISMEHLSPIFAKEFLDYIIEETNELLRDKDLKESSDAIDFLTSEIPKSSVLTMKDAINRLVQSKLETQMMARISSDYALKVIDSPFIPEKKSRPNRTFICLLMSILGGFFVTVFIIIRHYLIDPNESNLKIADI
jgi:uncharacterized protein involved in exopolysaccharide biosynthesis